MKDRLREEILSFLMMTAGAVIAAFALEEFLVPNSIFDGGVVGISMIMAYFLPLKLGILVVIINIPFVLAAWRILGHLFVVKFAYAVTLFSVMTAVFEPMVNATNDTILAVTFGGVLLGVGVGLVLKGGGCLDGTEVVAVILNRKFSISVGQTILLFNVFIYFGAGIVFGLDRGMYSLLMYIITSKVIDFVEIGGNTAKSVMVITDHGRELADRIYRDLGRTVTFMKGEGLISSTKKEILYCVVTRAEIFELKKIIRETPGSMFTTISEVSEIVGNHIKKKEEAALK